MPRRNKREITLDPRSARRLAGKIAAQIDFVAASLCSYRNSKCSAPFNDCTLRMLACVSATNVDIMEIKVRSVPSQSVTCFAPHFNLLWYKYCNEAFEKADGDKGSQLPLCRMYVVLARYQVFARLNVGAQASISCEVNLALRKR